MRNCAAIFSLGELKDSTAIPQLAAMLHDESTSFVFDIIEAIGKIGQMDGAKYIRPLLKSDREVAAEAAYALWRIGDSLSIGRAIVPLDNEGRMIINYSGPFGTFPYYSFFDVINGKIDANAFKNKIVLVGHLATGIADLNITPLGHNFPGIQ